MMVPALAQRLRPAVTVLAGVMMAATGFAESPPSCRDRLVGHWETSWSEERDWEPEGKPREPLLVVMYVVLKDDGTATDYMNYERPERRGYADPTAPPIINYFDGVWDTEPPKDPAVECRFFIDNDDMARRYNDVKFEGPDTYILLGGKENYTFTRVPAERATP